MVADKFTTNLPIKIKRAKRRETLSLFFRLPPALSLSPFRARAKNTPGKSAHRETGRRGAPERSANDRRPFKSRRLKSFSTRGSGKHRHGFSSTFQTPAARSSFPPLPRALALAHITYEHRTIPRNLYARYSRRSPLFCNHATPGSWEHSVRARAHAE